MVALSEIVDEVITSYLNGPGIDNKVRQTDANGNLYYSTDHLGSTVALTNDSGEMVEGIGYDSFGESTGSSLTRYTYTGPEFDSDTSFTTTAPAGITEVWIASGNIFVVRTKPQINTD